MVKIGETVNLTDSLEEGLTVDVTMNHSCINGVHTNTIPILPSMYTGWLVYHILFYNDHNYLFLGKT